MGRNEEKERVRARRRRRGLTAKIEIYKRAIEKEGGGQRGKKKSEKEVVRLASLPVVGEERPGFPLWLCPSLTLPALLLFIQYAKQLPVTLCDVPARQQSTHTHTQKNWLEQLDLNMHARTHTVHSPHNDLQA